MPDIHFILVEPGTPENIGFVARSIKNMGFESLVLVNPVDDFFEGGAKYTAYQAHDILLSAPIYSTLNEAIAGEGIDLVIGTSGHDCITRNDVIPSDEINSLIDLKGNSIKSVAIVFGSERSGMSKEDFGLCDVITTIPMKQTYPSINLSHSVMVYAYELSKLQLPEKRNQLEGDNGAVFSELKSVLVDFISKTSIENKPVLKQRIMDRAAFLGQGDLKIALQLMKAIKRLV